MKAFSLTLGLMTAISTLAANLGPWVAHDSGTTNRLNAVAFGADGFVAVGENGVVIHSIDGVTWQSPASGVFEHLHAITYANSNYVAVGAAGIILRSTNGLDWAATFHRPEITWRSIAFDANQFVIAGNTGATAASSSLVTWTNGILNFATRGDAMLPGFFCAATNGVIYASANGTLWGLRASDPSFRPFHGGTKGPAGYVVVGGAGETTRSALYTSPDGAQWTSQNSTSGFGLNDVAWGLNQFVAVGDSSLTVIASSLTGWTGSLQSGVPSLYGVAYGNNRFVTVGAFGYAAEKYNSETILITEQPQNQSVYPWQAARFEVKAIGGLAPLQYQWYKGPALIPDARSNVLSFIVRDTLAEGTYRAVVTDGFTSANSDSATLELLIDFITSLNKPSPDSEIPRGVAIPLEATVEGEGTITNINFFDGAALLGSDASPPFGISASLNSIGIHSITAVAYNDAGQSSTSGVVNVTVVSPNPEITSQPLSQSVFTPTTITLASGATGITPITYQWIKDGAPIPGAQSNQLTFSVTNFMQAGLYQLFATGPYGSATSAPARIDVTVERPDFVKMFHDHDPGGSATRYSALAYGNGTYLATGAGIATSPDGVEWVDTFRYRDSTGNIRLNDVIYAQNKFVAVGASGLTAEFIAVSTNGYSWSIKRNSGSSGQLGLRGIAYGNGIFVAVGTTGFSRPILTSPDGEVWTPSTTNLSPPPTQFGLFDVLFHPTLQRFFTYTLGAPQNHRFYSSSNGVNWTVLPEAALGLVNRVDLFGTNFIALTETGIFTSPDAATWTRRLNDGAYKFGTTIGSGANIRYAAYRIDGFRARTTDAETFTVETTDAPAAGLAAIWENGAALMVTSSSGIFGSLDGIAWSPVRANRWRHDIQETSFARDRFYIHGTTGVMPVGDGLHPVSASIPITSTPYTAAYGANKYVVSAALGTIWHSDNGLSFTPVAGSSSLTRLIFEENKFIAVGDTAGKYSTDGVTWNPLSDAFPSQGIAYGNGRFVSVHNSNGAVRYSDDGINWGGPGPFTLRFSRVTFGRGVFAAVTLGENHVAYSTDGINWPLARNQFSSRALLFAEGLFIASNDTDGRFMYSLDAINWYGTPYSLWRGAAYGQGLWMLTGNTGQILQTGYPSEFPIPPQIVQEPSDLHLPNYLSGELRVRAVGAETLRYQWFKDNFLIQNQTNATLQIPGGQIYNGAYHVQIQNNAGTITTRTAQVNATGGPDPEPIPPTLAAASTPEGILITITGEPNSTIRLESSETLAPNSWTLVEEITLTNEPVTRTYNSSDHTFYFLRAQIVE